MKLFRIETAQLGDYYVVAESCDSAITKLSNKLSEADYGFTDHRRVRNIDILTDEVGIFGPKEKPYFSDNHRLIL